MEKPRSIPVNQYSGSSEFRFEGPSYFIFFLHFFSFLISSKFIETYSFQNGTFVESPNGSFEEGSFEKGDIMAVKEFVQSCADKTSKEAVILGRSNIVGKPIALLLLHRHATVTLCHSKTRDLAEKVSRAARI